MRELTLETAEDILVEAILEEMRKSSFTWTKGALFRTRRVKQPECCSMGALVLCATRELAEFHYLWGDIQDGTMEADTTFAAHALLEGAGCHYDWALDYGIVDGNDGLAPDFSLVQASGHPHYDRIADDPEEVERWRAWYELGYRVGQRVRLTFT